MAAEAWRPYDPCPCGCTREGLVDGKTVRVPVIGWKLKVPRYACFPGGCVVGCNSASCRGRRNKSKGRRAQARGYRRLGGSAPFTPGHEENQGTLSLEIQMESKAGRQIPASLRKFVETEWARRAWSQADRAIPEGVQAHPAIYVEIPRQGWFLIVRGQA